MIEQFCDIPERSQWFTPQAESADIRFGGWIENLYNPEQAGPGDIILLGIPQDEGVRRNGGRPGAQLAPMAIRRALGKLSCTGPIGVNLAALGFRIFDAGDIRCESLSLGEIRAVHQHIAGLLLGTGASLIVLGGGHDIAWPDAAALSAHALHGFSIINIDPHLDVRPLIPDNNAHSGSPFREILENLNNVRYFAEFGTQAFAAADIHLQFAQKHHADIYWYHRLRARNTIYADFCACTEKALAAAPDLYISFDTDALASAYGPGVSAPASPGFTADEFCMMAYRAGQTGARLIDFVEMNPAYDVDGRTARIIALSIAWTVFGLCCPDTEL